jgi:hypothetical protein
MFNFLTTVREDHASNPIRIQEVFDRIQILDSSSQLRIHGRIQHVPYTLLTTVLEDQASNPIRIPQPFWPGRIRILD